MKWDEWRFNKDGNRPVFFIKHLVKMFGCRIDIHKMVSADDPGCFHSHPAHAIRIILWGGYVEEVYDEEAPQVWEDVISNRHWFPCMFGWVRPKLTHRIQRLYNRKYSYSIWIRFRKQAEIQLRGDGWQTSRKRESNGKEIESL